jgi:16S rRNA (cytidine1402-2'-O)-methyltransferase
VTLVVCATPIGNLNDVTLRVLAELRQADVVLCEDTRRTRILLDRHGIQARTVSYHRHNEAARTAEMLPRLLGGERIALASDAGLPGISDPGAMVVRAAIDAGVEVTVLPGASAVETALVVSGLGSGGYRFVGYLPRREGDLRALWNSLEGGEEAVVAFESPNRLPRSLASLAAALPGRRVAVCRELTKRFEEVVRGTTEEVAARFPLPPKGEVTLVLSPGDPRVGGKEGGDDRSAAAVAAVAELVAAGLPRRRAAELIGAVSGVPRNRLYRGSL